MRYFEHMTTARLTATIYVEPGTYRAGELVNLLAWATKDTRHNFAPFAKTSTAGLRRVVEDVLEWRGTSALTVECVGLPEHVEDRLEHLVAKHFPEFADVAPEPDQPLLLSAAALLNLLSAALHEAENAIRANTPTNPDPKRLDPESSAILTGALHQLAERNGEPLNHLISIAYEVRGSVVDVIYRLVDRVAQGISPTSQGRNDVDAVMAAAAKRISS